MPAADQRFGSKATGLIPFSGSTVAGAGNQALTGTGRMHYLQLVAGSAAASATFRDSADNTGTVLAVLAAAATTSANLPLGDNFVPIAAGINVMLTGTGAQVNVGYVT